MSDNPFSFDGRIRRTEYCLSYIAGWAIQLALQYLLTDVEFASIIYILCLIPLVWFLLAQGTKRCHDMGTSGWFLFIPGYLLWMSFAPGHPEDGKYGAADHPVPWQIDRRP